MDLTHDQQKALDSSKSFWVNACAGSGKTHVLACRIIRLMLEGVDPSRILAITFTKKAAQEMAHRVSLELESLHQASFQEKKKRLSYIMPVTEETFHIFEKVRLLYLHSPPAIHTFHSFCHKLLHTFSSPFLFVLEQELAEKKWNEAYNLELACLEEMSDFGRKVITLATKEPYLVKKIKELYKDKYSSSIFREALSHPPSEGEDSHGSENLSYLLCLKVARRYHLLKEGCLDFDELLWEAFSLLHHPSSFGEVSLGLYNTIDHLLLDEAQDTSILQWQIVKSLADILLTNPLKTFFIVGDPQQSIYGFQGACLKVFYEMKSFLKAWITLHGGEIDFLSFHISFRSAQKILAILPYVFRHHSLTQEPFKNVQGKIAAQGTVAFLVYEKDPVEHWVTVVKEWIKNPLYLFMKDRPMTLQDIMVLLPRRTSFFHALHKEFIHQGFIYELSQSFSMELLKLLIQWALTPEDDELLFSLLSRGLMPFSAEILFQKAYQRGTASLWDTLRNSLEQLSSWLNTLRCFPPFQAFVKLLYEQGLMSYLLQLDHGNPVMDIHYFEDLLCQWIKEFDNSFQGGTYHCLYSFLSFLQERSLKTDSRGINLLTIHSAKGLEAPIVILPDLPPPFRGEHDQKEYWRLLYVALTRSREYLYMASIQSYKEGWGLSLKKTVEEFLSQGEKEKNERGNFMTL